MQTSEQQKYRRKRQLTIQYMVAVSLIFLVSMSSLLTLKYIMKQQEGYASVINISGRQRMLSQQIALLGHEIISSKQGDERENLLKKINFSINLMKESHHHLISGKAENNSGVELSETISRMYFQPPLEVDRLVREYLTAIIALTTAPERKTKHPELSSLSITARGPLLDALNQIVSQYEAESIRYSDILKASAMAIFLLMILLLTIIVIFGFRPMADIVAENESMLNSILDSIPILMDIVSTDGTILYQSTFLLNLIGDSNIGMKCFEAYRHDQTPCLDCPTRQEKFDPATKITTCFDRLAPGTVVEISHLPIIFKGQQALLHTFQDITEQKKTEDFLTKAKDEADHASELKSNFLANMSHEIRTPMNAIIGFSELALETEMDSLQQDYLTKINHSSHSLMEIINKILDFSKIEAGKLDLEKKVFRLEEIVADLNLLLGDRAKEKNIRLIFHLPPNIPALLIGDALRLQQILVNLIGNSIKFTDQGEITLKIQLKTLSTQQARLKFLVEDTGIGIDSDKLDHLFESFSQADTSTTRKYGGTGLGLAISRQLVDLLGGILEVSSTQGTGTVFTFTVPFGLADVAENNQLQPVKDESDLPDSRQQARKYEFNEDEAVARIRGAHILLVEDNSINRQVAEMILKRADIILDTAANGQQALEKIAVAESGYDAILMDIQMPVMGGVECTRQLRKNEKKGTDRIPVIALTANAILGDREQYMEVGMNDYIAKPINRTDLFCVLASWIPADLAKRITADNPLPTRPSPVRREDTSGGKYNGMERRESSSVKKEKDVGYILPESLAGIDLKQGLARLEGNQGLYLRLLNEFATNYGGLGSEIQQALDKQDLESAGRIVHTIKGVAGSLGARDLALVSFSLEQAIKAEEQIDEQLPRFTAVLHQVISSLATLSDQQKSPETTAEVTRDQNSKKIAALIVELNNMLVGKNFEAGSKWQELIPLLQDIPNDQRLRLDHSINNFDFEQACIILAEIDKNLQLSGSI